MAMLCERPPALLTPPNVIITRNRPRKGDPQNSNNNNNNNNHCMKVRLVEMHAGLVSVSDGKSKPQPMKLILTTDSLVLQKEQLVISTKNLDQNGPDSRVEVRYSNQTFANILF
ncbi:uncharacterized protein LOC125044128 [Penaeus chinensis]|uniref:uncharacterized protein LOC125044128 n=1 Tax=Penaeus chinensis TaxID=139456 RepID=UPI001FB7449F|nr:uncharacterized protein LOC125044128 [Penaeus chinensis]